MQERSKPRARVLLAVVMALGLSVALSACTDTNASNLSGEVWKVFRPDAKAGVATADFRTLVGGQWTQMTIVCTGASDDELNRALGFTWNESHKQLTAFGFEAMVVFSTKDSVVGYYNVGQDWYIESAWNFSPCAPWRVTGQVPPRQVLAIPRAATKLPISLFLATDLHKGDHPIWYFTQSEIDKLAVKYGST
ncbi:MAG: hypothetical protein JWN80_1260 [Microbacteriaceae bacterium]|nr:hypothetical protein [Microbacteriaceae bacterium]